MIDASVLDGQKLIYHTELLRRWQQGEDIYPIYFEISPVSTCNNRCVFCAYEYVNYSGKRINAERLRAAIECLARGGAKSCMYAGEGEPLLHPAIAELIAFTKGRGIDVALTSNMLTLDRGRAEAILPQLTWARCSLNACNEEQYGAIQRGPRGGFERVLGNLATAVDVKRTLGLETTLGVQCVALAENVDSIPDLARRVREIGVDYFSMKPCIQHPRMQWQAKPIDEARFESVAVAVEATSVDGFRAVARRRARAAAIEGHERYEQCLALPFFVEIMADGGVYSCGPHLGEEAFCYGNIEGQSFDEIWRGGKRRHVCQWAASDMDISQCMNACRLNEVNALLWSLRHPPAHVNFI